LINGCPFPSREQTAKFLDIHTNVVRYNMDYGKPGGTSGYYLSSKPLTGKEIKDLFELSIKK
jgi:hypothetical protein